MGLSRRQNPRQEGTYHVKATKWRPALKVTADGKGLATHAGRRLPAEVADRSMPTPTSSTQLPPTKRGTGFFPLGAWLDNTCEALAGILRPGNAGANTAADHIEVLDLALAQLPVAPRGLDPVGGVAMLARADSAGCTHEFLNALRRYGIEYSVGADVTENVQLAILDVPAGAWVEAIDQDCALRGGAGVAELTDLLDLSAWPSGTRAICRREEPHPGAHFTLFDPEGWRYQVFLTDSADDDLSYLEARHRGHARVEDRIRCAKDTGLRNLPFYEFANTAVHIP